MTKIGNKSLALKESD